ncbi:50S ribosomal protein L32 [Nocardioides fonticola]|uniref:Large ribosomal subunit protein bL32 n=1 Tax=Nocardioides fonticola TaxID=450363 RepID=A0ABP7X9U6_9ACTN
MAVPKRRMSRSNTRHRRSSWTASRPDLVPVTIDGEEYRVPRRLVRAVSAGLVDPATGRALPSSGRREAR